MENETQTTEKNEPNKTKFVYLGSGDLKESIKNIPHSLKDVSQRVLVIGVIGNKNYLLVPNRAQSGFPDEKTAVSYIQDMQSEILLSLQAGVMTETQLDNSYLIKQVEGMDIVYDISKGGNLEDAKVLQNSFAERNQKKDSNLELSLKHQSRIFSNIKGRYLSHRYQNKH